jgi:hypothetical protein
MDANSTLGFWVIPLRSNLLDTGSSNITDTLSSILEIIVMVGYGGRVDTNSTPPAGHDLQGCLTPRAAIPWPVSLLLLITTLGLTLMLVYWAVLFFQLRSASSLLSERYAKSVNMATPNGLVGWIMQSVREHNRDAKVEASGLGHWDFGQESGGRMSVQRRKNVGAMVEGLGKTT